MAFGGTGFLWLLEGCFACKGDESFMETWPLPREFVLLFGYMVYMNGAHPYA